MDALINQRRTIQSLLPSLKSNNHLSYILSHPYQTRFQTKLYHFYNKYQKPHQITMPQLQHNIEVKPLTPQKINKKQRLESTASKPNNYAKSTYLPKSVKSPNRKTKKITKMPIRDRFNNKIYYRINK